MEIKLDAAARAAIVASSLAETLKFSVLNQLLLSDFQQADQETKIALLKDYSSNQRRIIGAIGGVARVMVESLVIDTDTTIGFFKSEISAYTKALQEGSPDMDAEDKLVSALTTMLFNTLEDMIVRMLTDSKNVKFTTTELPSDLTTLLKDK